MYNPNLLEHALPPCLLGFGKHLPFPPPFLLSRLTCLILGGGRHFLAMELEAAEVHTLQLQ